MSAPLRTSAEVTQTLRRRLSEVIAERTEHAARHGEPYRRLWELTGAACVGGKLLRPLLLMNLFEALAPAAARRPAAREVAVGLEILHLAFLLHDDVLDGDLRRRGRPNLIGALLAEVEPGTAPHQAHHWAAGGGLLMGDLLLAQALGMVEDTDLPATVRRRLRGLFHEAIETSVAGEQLDIGLSDGTLRADRATVLRMTESKTAHYTFVLPLSAAAVLAERPDLIGPLTAVGGHLGLSFQLQDDLLSVFGDPGLHGKPPHADLTAHKRTLLLVAAEGTEQWPRLRELLAPDRSDPADAKEAAGLLEACGARATVQRLAEHEMRTALVLADALPDRAAAVVRSLTAELRGRAA